MFGPSAQVNVGGLLATTSNITNEDFLAGRYRFFSDPNYTTGSVINYGNIQVQTGGLAALIGNGVSNAGVIKAKMGTVILGGAQAYTLDFDGDQLINFVVQKGPSGKAVDENGNRLSADVSNTGLVDVRGGIVTTGSAKSVIEHSINMAGLKEANHVAMRGGRIILEAGNGRVHVAGRLHARRGKVSIHGNDVALNNAQISTSGRYVAGVISIIGDKSLSIYCTIIPTRN